MAIGEEALLFKSIIQGLDALKGLVQTADAKAKIAELYGLIASGQQSLLESTIKQRAQLEEIDDLKKKLIRIEGWEETKKRYQLHEIEPGIFAYGVKEATKGADPAHWACPNCYENGRRSILQYERVFERRRRFYKCVTCGLELELHHLDEVSKPKYL